ncbi:MAG: hypothetical protein HKP02_11645, partial [Xanthomonadales bacterium]|nr:hypothetical protein [Xanthomonadales bacterium]
VADRDALDAGMIFGTGFAPFRGGPLFYLDGLAGSAAAAPPAAVEEPEKEPEKEPEDSAGEEERKAARSKTGKEKDDE